MSSLWLVTGGVGFIGFHLSRALLARGDRVRIVDDFSNAPYPTVMKEQNAKDLGVEVVRGCVTDGDLAPEILEGVSGVLHLAGLAGVRPSFADPARYAKVNVEGTANLVDAAAKAGIEKFIFASSSSVYGNATPLPAREDAPAVIPESPYAASKRGAELILEAMSRRAPSMHLASLRFFTVYGPRQRPEMAITTFLRKILAGETITMFGDGSMKRDFTHCDDIVRGVVAALDRAPKGHRAYNLGSGAPITLRDLVSAMEVASGREATIESAPVPLGDVDATFADIARAKNELDWSPRIPLADGLRTVVDYLRA